MTPELYRQWAAELRSGRWAQGRFLLHNEETKEYCCLGVLRCIQLEREPGQSPYTEGDSYGRSGLTYAEQFKFTDLNDQQNLTFPQIADYIERELLKEVPND